MSQVLESGTDRYHVGKSVANASTYRLYLCTPESSKRQCLLQIAATVEHSGELDRSAYVLQELKQRADALEAEYARIKTDSEDLLNYDLGFPELVDSFVWSQQDNRRVNILAFRKVEDVSTMIPLSRFRRDGLRVDLRTSAWIMGKLLKLLAFAHSEGILIRRVTSNNVLIEPDQHYVVIFDWSSAQTLTKETPGDRHREEIANTAKTVIALLGGSLETGAFPDDGEEGFNRYTDHLLRLARGVERSAEKAHGRFYELVDQLWKRGFHPFTTHSLEEGD